MYSQPVSDQGAGSDMIGSRQTRELFSSQQEGPVGGDATAMTGVSEAERVVERVFSTGATAEQPDFEVTQAAQEDMGIGGSQEAGEQPRKEGEDDILDSGGEAEEVLDDEIEAESGRGRVHHHRVLSPIEEDMGIGGSQETGEQPRKEGDDDIMDSGGEAEDDEIEAESGRGRGVHHHRVLSPIEEETRSSVTSVPPTVLPTPQPAYPVSTMSEPPPPLQDNSPTFIRQGSIPPPVGLLVATSMESLSSSDPPPSPSPLPRHRRAGPSAEQIRPMTRSRSRSMLVEPTNLPLRPKKGKNPEEHIC